MSIAPRFLSDEHYDLNKILGLYVNQIREYRRDGMPRFGQLSLMPMVIRLYDNEQFAERMGRTAFVIDDTGEIYMYAPFMKALIEGDIQNANDGYPTTDAMFVLLHEQSHPLLNHIHDMPTLIKKGYSQENLNIAMDTKINEILCLYQDIKLSPVFTDSVWDDDKKIITQGFFGFNPKEIQFFKASSYLEIANHYQEQEKKAQENKKDQPKNDDDNEEDNDKNQSKSGKGGKSKPTPNNDQGNDENNEDQKNGNNPVNGDKSDSSKSKNENGSNESSSPQDGQSNDGEPKPSSPEDFGTDHNRTLKEVVDALKASGLGHVVKHFGYPDKVTEEVSRTLKDKKALIIDRAISQMSDLKNKNPNACGDHMDSFMEREYQAAKPRAIALNNLKNEVASILGGNFNYTEAEPGMQVMMDTSFNMAVYGVPSMPYVGSYAPLDERKDLFVILDTSYSMMGDPIQHALGAVVGLAQENKHISGVYLAYADTQIRKVEYYDRKELAELTDFNISGMGGTDMCGAIVSSFIVAKEQNNIDFSSVKAVILIHDGDDYTAGERMDEVYSTVIDETGCALPPLICLIPPGCSATRFITSMETHAVTLLLDNSDQENQIDFDEAYDKSQARHEGLSL